MVSFLSWLGWGVVPSAAPLSIAAWDAPANNQGAIVLADILGKEVPPEALPVDRLEALTVPAVAAAHATLVSAFGNLQLSALRTGAALGSQPTWLTQTGKGAQPWYLRNSRTLGDFMFIGLSLWQCTRGSDKYPNNAWHVPWGRWKYDDNGVILIDEREVDQSSVILFESGMPGLLNTGTRTLRSALEIEHTISERARVSVPMMLLQNTADTDPDPAEVADLLKQYKSARSSRDGSTVAWLPSGIDAKVLEDPVGAWLLEARNAVGADIAKHVGVPATQVGSTSAIDSLTYTTQLGQMSQLMTQTASLYLAPIEARLSMGDVTPAGQTVEFVKTPLEQALQAMTPTPAPTSENQGVNR